MKFRILCVLLGVIFLSSCSSLSIRNTGNRAVSSSLMDFLYPGKEGRGEHKPEIPVLRLPVNIGLAFVPSTQWQRNGVRNKTQIELLEKVRNSFVKYEFINRIEVIPSTYLKGGKGFATLEQVARLHDVDIIALVSYDQVTQSYKNNAALLYWTIVGMYVIPGNENSVQTFVDTAVFDVKSKKMLFRAPGISKLEKRTTAVGIEGTLSEKSFEGFDLAVIDMISNLDDELSRFRERVKEEKIAKIEHRKGYSGGGSMGLFLIVFTFVLLAKIFNRSSTQRIRN